jgi:glycosyltransferase involved in cell wall biosynthesis
MRVLFVIYGSLRQISGGYLYDRKVVEYLREQGVEVDCLELPSCAYLLCPLHCFYRPLRRLFANPPSKVYDCIIIDELTHPSMILPLSRRRRSGTPVVVLLHHLKIQEGIGFLPRIFVRWMERSLLRHCDRIIVNSRTTRETVGKLTDSKEGIDVCPPGSDTLIGNPGAEESGNQEPAPAAGEHPVRLLITGNIIRRKGHDLLIRMLADLAGLNWELRVVGGAVDPGYKRRVDRLVRRYGLVDRVVYTGVLSGRALSRQYREADVFVFPSRYEGFGISLAEAIRAGLPFIAFASGAIPEVCGGRGLLVTEGNLESFQQQLKRLICDPAFREQAAGVSRSLAAGLPTWRETGETFLQAIVDIVSRDQPN